MHYLQDLKTDLNDDSTGFLGFDQGHVELIQKQAAYSEIVGIPMVERIAFDVDRASEDSFKLKHQYSVY